MEIESFLKTRFLDLPWTIVGHICDYLPSETVYEILLQVPRLRDVIIDQYYSQEIHLVLSPTKRPHFCSPDPQRRELIDVLTYGEIEDFLQENPDIVPRSYKVITSGDFRSMEALLTQFHDRLSRVDNLEIYIENYELSNDDVDLIFSFPNLTKFQTSRIKLRHCIAKLSEKLSESQRLKQLVFLGHEVRDWSRVKFPPFLSHLDASWYPETNVSTMHLPGSLENLYWNQAGLTNNVLNDLRHPPLLKTLMLTYCNLASVNVSQLPSTLETIDFSFNNIHEFEFQESNPHWPVHLKSIFLQANLISDKSLLGLSLIQWPPFLEDLRLDANELTSLENLTNLPGSLRYLDLSDTKLRSFNVAHNEDDSAFFKFPESLDTLNLMGCHELAHGDASAHDVFPPEHRISFPERLESLNLTECNVNRLSYFIFPKSLKKLFLSGNRLRDLTSYDLTLCSSEIVSWKHLTNLKELELYYNEIESLRNWNPPESLRTLDLRRNKFSTLTSRDTPLFSEVFKGYTDNLQTLNFEWNEIESIDSSLHLPQNLIAFDLSKNKLIQFEFSRTFAAHENLLRLNLSGNAIEKVVVDVSDQTYTSHLKQLDLSRNACAKFLMTADEFYDAFEKIGLVVIKRKHNLKSLHTFR